MSKIKPLIPPLRILHVAGGCELIFSWIGLLRKGASSLKKLKQKTLNLFYHDQIASDELNSRELLASILLLALLRLNQYFIIMRLRINQASSGLYLSKQPIINICKLTSQCQCHQIQNQNHFLNFSIFSFYKNDISCFLK